MNILTEAVGAHDHVLGRPDAPATLVEYGDYECPFCAQAQGEVAVALRQVGSGVRFAFRHFPLANIHPLAVLAAQAVEAAGEQGRFWPMHVILFARQEALEPEDLLAYAESLHLDVRKFAAELRDGAHVSKVKRDLQSGIQSGVMGTPTFFLNGRKHEGSWNAGALAAAVRAATPPREQPKIHA